MFAAVHLWSTLLSQINGYLSLSAPFLEACRALENVSLQLWGTHASNIMQCHLWKVFMSLNEAYVHISRQICWNFKQVKGKNKSYCMFVDSERGKIYYFQNTFKGCILRFPSPAEGLLAEGTFRYPLISDGTCGYQNTWFHFVLWIQKLFTYLLSSPPALTTYLSPLVKRILVTWAEWPKNLLCFAFKTNT